MTKEELLTQLNEIKETTIKDATLSELTDEQREEQLQAQREYLNVEIRNLTDKLANDDNYILAEYTECQEKIDELSRNITLLSDSKTANDSNITNIERLISTEDKNLDAAKALLGEVIGNYDVKNMGETEDGLEIQVSNELGFDEEYLREEIRILEDRKNNLVEQLKTANKRKEELEKQEASYNDSMNLYRGRLNSFTSSIDQNKKDVDNKQLESLNNRLAVINSENPYLLYDFSKDLTDLINNVESGYITNEGVINRLNILAVKYPKKDADTVTQQLENNRLLQEEVSKEIAVLTEKLADDINYTPSRLQKDSLEVEIAEIDDRIGNYERAATTVAIGLLAQKRIKEDLENSITNLSETKGKYEDEIVSLTVARESTTNKKRSDRLLRQINVNKKEIKRIDSEIDKNNKTISGVDATIKSMEANQKNYESLKSQELKKKDGKLKLLDDTTTVNQEKKDEDKNKLGVLSAELASLVAVKAAIEFDYEKSILQVKDNLEKANEKDVVVAPIAASQTEVEPIPIVMWKKAQKIVSDKIKDKDFVRRAKAAIAVAIVAAGVWLGSKSGCAKEEVPQNDLPPVSDTIDEPTIPDTLNDSNYEDMLSSLGNTEKEPETEKKVETPVQKVVAKPTPKPQPKPTTPAPVTPVEPTTPEVINPIDIPSVDDSKPSQDIRDEEEKKPSIDIFDKEEDDKDNNKKPNKDESDKDKDENSNDKDDDKPSIINPTPSDLETVTQEIEKGNVGIIVTGSEEEPTIALTDNSAPEYIQDASEELAQKYAETLENFNQNAPEIMTSIDDDNVTELSYDNEGTVNIEAKAETPTEAPTLLDTVENIAEEQYGTGYNNLSSLFAEFNAAALEEQTLEEGGKTR